MSCLFILCACQAKEQTHGEQQQQVNSSQQKPDKQKDISDPSNTLSEKNETLSLKYIVWGCECPEWMPFNANEKADSSIHPENCIYIEAEKDSLKIPETFDPWTTFIEVSGRFYKNKNIA